MLNKAVFRDSQECASARAERPLARLTMRLAACAMLVSVSLAVIYSSNAFAQTSQASDDASQSANELEFSQTEADLSNDQASQSDSAVDAVLGSAEITESRRENGQRYRIELDHSSGPKQYIEENDSDGKIESTGNDIEETPNLPKWKLGSW